MSYDVSLCDSVSGDVLLLDSPHYVRGGTYAIGGTRELWLNVTYNYGDHFKMAFGNSEGIRTIYGMSAAESIPVIESAIAKLADDATDNYWEATAGNAKRALVQLLSFAKMRPDGVWKGD